jgi:AraC-like DNA-binding protein
VACQGRFLARHAPDADQLADALRAGPVAAVLVSVSRYQPPLGASLARVVREFPRVPMVALVTEPLPQLGQALLALGQLGVRALVDVRSPTGWRDLRRALQLADMQAIEHQAMYRLRQALPPGTPDGMHTFLATLFQLPYTVTTVREVAERLGTGPTTFMSRFYRAKLPPAKLYLAYARLVRAAQLLEDPGRSLTQVALLLEYSSPQSFARHLQFLLNLSAADFRTTCPAPVMLDRFVRDLVTPYRDRLVTFDPLQATPPWILRQERWQQQA